MSWCLVGSEMCIRDRWVGLPNILCSDFVVPEFLQGTASPQALSRSILAWLDNASACTKAVDRFTQLHQELLCDTSHLAAKDVAEVLAR
jgi:lipid-A-disaccharide synthase